MTKKQHFNLWHCTVKHHTLAVLYGATVHPPYSTVHAPYANKRHRTRTLYGSAQPYKGCVPYTYSALPCEGKKMNAGARRPRSKAAPVFNMPLVE